MKLLITRASAGAVVALTLGLLIATGVRAAPEGAVGRAVYDHAAQFFTENLGNLVLNAAITPHWRAGSPERFTYRRELAGGRSEFIQVIAATGKHTRAFDHAVVAQGLSAALGKPIDLERLPFNDYDELDSHTIGFAVEGTTWTCSISTPECRKDAAAAPDPLAVSSPDGKWLAFLEGGNLWIRSSDGAMRFPLTNDAAPHYSYAVRLESTRGLENTGAAGRALAVKDGKPVAGPPGPPEAPLVLWSPDSGRLFTYRLDERAVREITLVQSTPTDGSARPIANTWRYAMPNDPAIPLVEPWVFDVEQRSGHVVAVPPIPTVFTTPVEAKRVWWSPKGERLYLITHTRYFKSLTLEVVDPLTGTARELISETGKTYVESGTPFGKPMVYVLKNGDIIWFSERDGFGHLYLYDGSSGRLKRRLTQGSWTVRNVLELDESAGFIYIAGNEHEPGMDPYYRQIYRVSLSDGHVSRLSPEDADHHVSSAQESIYTDRPTESVRSPQDSHGFSPSGRFFLDTYGRTDLPSRTVLRRADGHLIAQIERADVSRLLATGLVMPERFSALAADGQTRLYGNLLRPSHFDPAKRYPVLDSPYPGPQAHRAQPNLVDTVFEAQAYAELGFIVVLVDGRGTHGRSKAFHDESYGNLGSAGHLDDHVAVIRELGKRYPYMDLDRVGIYGTSGGSYATVRAMLTFPDFFKVGVADAGNHDQRGYLAVWGESYNGPEVGSNYTDAANRLLAKSLQGKLFLLHGDMDSNVLPSHTLQLVDALIKANKDFDLLIVPNDGHGTLFGAQSYARRRGWDFLVHNLLGATPPANYQFPAISTPAE